MQTTPIYKILTREEWRAFASAGRTAGAPVDLADGYIHFSTADQVAETAAKHFADKDDLILVAVDPAALGAALQWEPSRGGALFPHLYAPLDLAAVLWLTGMPLGPAGHRLPDPLPGAAPAAGG